MSELNKELQEYLNRGDSKSLSKEPLLPTTIKDLKIPYVGSWFGKSNHSGEDDRGSTSSISSSANGSNSSWFSRGQSDPLFSSLGRKQRILGFLASITFGLICFILAAMYAPFLLFKARKFSLLFTLGSLFTILSFSFLWGPLNHLRHLFSSERIKFTSMYLISLFATLYFALGLQSTILTSIAAVVQVGALLIFLISNVPGGQTGIRFFSGICSACMKSTVSKALPV